MLLQYERQLEQNGCKLIAGIDEAGRGPLAGPVVVASVIMPLDDIVDGINDSKKLSAKKRELLYDKIIEKAVDLHVAIVPAEIIDRINILNATKQGMLECIDGLKKADCVLIDAVKLQTTARTLSIIHGDALSYSIAAASIVAKVTRDRLMVQYDELFPEYGFASNKGYGAPKHLEALQKYGPTAIHRRSFLKNLAGRYSDS